MCFITCRYVRGKWSNLDLQSQNFVKFSHFQVQQLTHKNKVWRLNFLQVYHQWHRYHHQLNAYHLDMQFTMERGGKSLNFLHLKVTVVEKPRPFQIFESDIFRKATATDTMIKWSFLVPNISQTRRVSVNDTPHYFNTSKSH